MILLPSNGFRKKMKRFSAKLQRAVKERLRLFRENPSHPLLNDHALAGDRLGQRSINVTGDWRLVYILITPDTAFLLDIDTHHNLYGS